MTSPALYKEVSVMKWSFKTISSSVESTSIRKQHHYQTNKQHKMVANNLIKMLVFVPMMFYVIHQNEAKPSEMKYKSFRCRLDCRTDFDMCSTLVLTMEQYIVCFHAQRICNTQCRYKYGGKGHSRRIRLRATATTHSTVVGKKMRKHVQLKTTVATFTRGRHWSRL